MTIHHVFYRSFTFYRCHDFKIKIFLGVWGKFIFEIWGWKLFHFVFSILGKSIIPPLTYISSFFLFRNNYTNIITKLIFEFFLSETGILSEWSWNRCSRLGLLVKWYGLGWLGGMDDRMDNTTTTKITIAIFIPHYMLIMIPPPLLLPVWRVDIVAYRVNVVDEGVLIFVHVCNFCSRWYIGWGGVGWME